jgi:hypothetical protein
VIETDPAVRAPDRAGESQQPAAYLNNIGGVEPPFEHRIIAHAFTSLPRDVIGAPGGEIVAFPGHNPHDLQTEITGDPRGAGARIVDEVEHPDT